MINTYYTIILLFVIIPIQVLLEISLKVEYSRLITASIFTLIFFISAVYFLAERKLKLKLDPRTTTTHILVTAFLILAFIMVRCYSIYIQSVEPKRFYTFLNVPHEFYSATSTIIILLLLLVVIQIAWIIWLINRWKLERKTKTAI